MKTYTAIEEAKFKSMTEQLRLVNSDDQVAEYIKWIIRKSLPEGEVSIKHGDKVMCSNDMDFKDFWYGTYIGKHPRNDLHVVLTRARPELKIHEELDAYAFCRKR